MTNGWRRTELIPFHFTAIVFGKCLIDFFKHFLFEPVATARFFLIVGFFRGQKPTVKSNSDLTVAISLESKFQRGSNQIQFPLFRQQYSNAMVQEHCYLFTNFHVGSGSYSTMAPASSDVLGPRSFSYTRPC